MDAAARKQVRLILDDIIDRARLDVSSKLEAVFADHSAKGSLRSGATIKVSVRAMEELGEKLIGQSIDRVAPVAKDNEAFAMIQESVLSCISYMDDKIDRIATVAGGKVDVEGKGDSIYRAARDLFTKMKSRLLRQMEIHRFSFTVPTPSKLTQVLAPPAAASIANKGGKPLAEHWDSMWAEIATQLWNGDLDPKSQRDIKDAMFAWLNKNEVNGGDTAVTQRARALWTRMQTDK